MKELWKKRQALVERALTEEMAKTPVLDDTLRASMEYSLMAGGKRLRRCGRDEVPARGMCARDDSYLLTHPR